MQGRSRFVLAFARCFFKTVQKETPCSELVRVLKLPNKKLSLHPDKIIIRKLGQGIDFLGYVSLPHYRVLRTKTKRRMFGRINQKNLSSYLGVLSHCNSYKLKKKLINGLC